MKATRVKKHYFLIAALLIGSVALLIYLPALNHGFVNWDDPEYIYKNQNIQSLDTSSLKWMFTEFYAANWHPLTWLSHAIDFTLWDINPRGHHLSSILLHGLNSFLVALLLFYLISCQKTGHYKGPSHTTPVSLGTEDLITVVLAGLLFALHPLHVESVAWVSERKDLLCACFFILTIILYITYSTSAPGKKKGFTFAFCLFSTMLALLSKPMAVTIPAVLLLLDFYPLNRFNLRTTPTALRTLLLEKIPFCLLSCSSIGITIAAQKAWGAFSPLADRPLDIRLFVAAKSFCFYLLKMLVPTHLSPLYPYPVNLSLFNLQVISSLVCILALVSICIILRKRYKVLTFVFAYYGITLFPVLGILQVGGQAAADRYTYLPSIGPFLLIGLTISSLIKHFKKIKEHSPVTIYSISTLALLVLTCNAALTVKQITFWNDPISLWNRVIAVYPDQSWVAYYNRGSAFFDSSRYQEAVKDFSSVIALNPYYPLAHYQRGKSHLRAGSYSDALRDFSRAIELDKTNPTFYAYRAQAYRKLGEHTKALKDSATALRLKTPPKK